MMILMISFCVKVVSIISSNFLSNTDTAKPISKSINQSLFEISFYKNYIKLYPKHILNNKSLNDKFYIKCAFLLYFTRNRI